MTEITQVKLDEIRAELERLSAASELIVWEMADDRGLEIDEYVELFRTVLTALASQALRSQGEAVAFSVQPMDTAPYGDDALEPAEIDVHEGAWAIVLGTNAKPIGWIDTHAAFEGRTYRDRFTHPAPQEAGEVKVTGAMEERIVDALSMAYPHTLEFDAESGGYYDTDLSREISALLATTRPQPSPSSADKISDERLEMMISGSKLDVQMQTSARYKREAVEMVSILTELATRRAQSAVVGDGLPRLTQDMVYAAAVSHYGKLRVDACGGPEGISMTVDGTDYSFTKAFRRMWSGARKALNATQEGK